MASTWFSCKPCVGSDPTSDTVKVDPKLLLVDNGDKENAQPLQLQKQGEEEERVRQMKEQKMAEERRKQAEEAAEAAAVAARQNQERLRREAQKAAEEKTRREAEEQRREEEAAVAAKAVAAAAAVAVEEKLQQEMAVERVRQETQRAAEEQAQRELEAAELVAAQAKVDEWCKNNGFQDSKTQKKTYMGARKFPLHTAVKHKQEDMVGLLLKCGADKFAKDSRKQTPSELAANWNRNGSHDRILALLV